MKKIHLIGICGTAMATLAAHAEAQGPRRPRVRPQRLPADEHVPRGEGIATLAGYRAEHITDDLDLVVVGNAISRGNPEVEEVLDRKIRLLLAARGRSRALPLGRAVDRHRRHARQDHDDGAWPAWLLTAAGCDPSMLVGGIAANFGEDGSSYRLGQRPRLRHRGRRVRQRLLRQDGEVPEVPAGHRGHRQHRVRPRGHLRRPRRDPPRVPPAGEPRARARPAAARRRQPRGGRACGPSPGRRSRRSDWPRTPTGTRTTCASPGAGTSFGVRHARSGPGPVRGAAARGAQRAERARGDGRRPRRRRRRAGDRGGSGGGSRA